jgi:hypothetical protein
MVQSRDIPPSRLPLQAMPKKKKAAAAQQEDSFDPHRECEEELLVVQSIFMDEASVADGEHGKVVGLKLLPCPNRLPGEENHCEALLEAHLPPSYPILPPRLQLTAVRGLRVAEVEELRAQLAEHVAANAGYPQLMGLAELARGFLIEHNQTPSSYEEMLRRADAHTKARRDAATGASSALGSAEEAGNVHLLLVKNRVQSILKQVRRHTHNASAGYDVGRGACAGGDRRAQPDRRPKRDRLPECVRDG